MKILIVEDTRAVAAVMAARLTATDTAENLITAIEAGGACVDARQASAGGELSPLFRQADEWLYRAKQAGRNRFCHAGMEAKT